MKTSAVLASILFGSYAVAAPFDRRALVYKTEVVTETVVVYTTIWDDETTAQPTTTSAGEFYEQPSKPSTTSTVVVPSSSAVVTPQAAPTKAAPTSSKAAPPAYTPVVPEKPSSVYTPPVETPTSVYTPPAPTTPAPAPVSSYVAPPPAPEPTTTAAPEPVYSQAPAPAPSSAAPSYGSGGVTSGESFDDVEITVYDMNVGDLGACGELQTDDSKVVAISIGAWNAMGGSIHDVMTGESSNPWCGKQIEIEYQGKTATAKIMDMCPGCVNKYDIDLSRSVWSELGLSETTRYHGVNWKII
ncbi:uncharacterized protein J4E88_000541 [Alternaria novae-zelandiae]|uniref:uncharacterized protein n=1 Tax=Alternaria novae-zelandiae TaxID=430562 RepID=UPI0020C4C5F6|nr:uncharacterized protein J4E88_000541 [Alternaria novae-zelandiae]XP_051356414.1 uncharacterized protein J4E92_001772 [Alternaria infectoria]KAI4696364.1 hypothetical protein J4E88_000541 [Alternaria novae-zelandiae]KAI4937047.1 hypothetical protein J4E92_001772 [Alternaria infectoria]